MLSSEPLFPSGAARKREREPLTLGCKKRTRNRTDIGPERETAEAEIKIVSEVFEAAKGNTQTSSFELRVPNSVSKAVFYVNYTKDEPEINGGQIRNPLL